MIAAFRRFFRRFSPRVVEISIIEERTGSLLLRAAETVRELSPKLEEGDFDGRDPSPEELEALDQQRLIP